MKKLASIFLFILMGNILIFSQVIEKGNLVLEVTYLNEKEPAHIAIYNDKDKLSGARFGRFKRLSNSEISSPNTVRAVNVVTFTEGNSVKVNVLVLTGVRSHDKEEFIASYNIRENEKILVEKLADVNVKPFLLKLIRVTQTVATPPNIINKTNSIQILGIEPVYSTLPSYKIKLSNNSSTPVSAFIFKTIENEKIVLSGMPQGFRGKPLIKSGEIYEQIIPSNYQNEILGDGKIPLVKNYQTFILQAVVFEDRTFEGEPFEAARFLAFTYGRKMQLERIIPILNESLKNESNLKKLYRQIENLSIELDKKSFDQFLSQFSGFSGDDKNRMRVASKVAANGITREVANNLDTFTQSQESYEINYFERLNDVNEKYKEWLNNLNKIWTGKKISSHQTQE